MIDEELMKRIASFRELLSVAPGFFGAPGGFFWRDDNTLTK
jgi:hypothetical protein